jgi:hypothetical protein
MTAELSQSPVRFIVLDREKTKIRTDLSFFFSFSNNKGWRIVAVVNFFVTLRVSGESIVLFTSHRYGRLCKRESLAVAFVAVSLSKDSASCNNKKQAMTRPFCLSGGVLGLEAMDFSQAWFSQ